MQLQSLRCPRPGNYQLFKPFYGRYAGTEGNLKTAVVDSLLLEIPDPRLITEGILHRMEQSIESKQKRDLGHLVEHSCLIATRLKRFGRPPNCRLECQANFNGRTVGNWMMRYSSCCPDVITAGITRHSGFATLSESAGLPTRLYGLICLMGAMGR